MTSAPLHQHKTHAWDAWQSAAQRQTLLSPLQKVDRPTAMMWAASLYLGLWLLPSLVLPAMGPLAWLVVLAVHIAGALALYGLRPWWTRTMDPQTVTDAQERFERYSALTDLLGADQVVEAHHSPQLQSLDIALESGTLHAFWENDAQLGIRWKPAQKPARLQHMGAGEELTWVPGDNGGEEGTHLWTCRTPNIDGDKIAWAIGDALRRLVPSLHPVESSSAKRHFQALNTHSLAFKTKAQIWWIPSSVAGLILGALVLGTHLGLAAESFVLQTPMVSWTLTLVATVVLLLVTGVSMQITIPKARRERRPLPTDDPALILDNHGLTAPGPHGARIEWTKPFTILTWRSANQRAARPYFTTEVRQGTAKITFGAPLPASLMPNDLERLDVQGGIELSGTDFLEARQHLQALRALHQ